MSEIKVEKLPQEQLKEKGVFSWPIWEKEASRFDWHYDTTETCYILKGNVTVETKSGEAVKFGPGDFVTFPKGLDCVWDIKEPVKKHYSFK
ncbi:MAG: cupin domain-containing protein [Desulfobacterales bacterium]